MSEAGAAPAQGRAAGTLQRALGGIRWPVAALVAALGMVATAVLSSSAYTVDRHSERRLLVSQTRQAANGVAAAIVGIVAPLRTVAAVAQATDGDVAQVMAAADADVGPGRTFVSVVVLRRAANGYQQLASAGLAPHQPSAAPAVQDAARRAASTLTSFVVNASSATDGTRVSYAVASTTGQWVVYAERAIPANRRVAVESTSAFAGLHFATYLGTVESPAALQTTDLPDSRLPLRGSVVRTSIPFGTNRLLLVTKSAHRLGGALEWGLWWLVAVTGAVATAIAAGLIGALAQRRRDAEGTARTIATLYDELSDGYTRQRTIAETLQRALLPQYFPELPGVELATCYVAGGRGAEVGGDWFSAIRVDDDRFAFVIGDVSGRGVAAAAVMARLRFTVRAYLLEGHPPDVVLGMCSRDLDVRRDGHLATVLVGLAELSTGEMQVASAGHLSPLLVEETGTRPLPVRVGRPLGVGAAEYPLTKTRVPPGATVLAFTDGLVERREEALEVGVARLVHAARPPGTDLDAWLEHLRRTMTPDGGTEDDIALLALRWATSR